MGQRDKRTIWGLLAKKLADEASPDEVGELERLLKDSPDLHYPTQTVSDLWNSSGKPDEEDPELAFGRHVERMKDQDIEFAPIEASRRTRRRTLFLSLSLTGFIGLVIAITWSTHRPSHSEPAPIVRQAAIPGNEINTANGSRTHLTLPDGTRVWLNASSRLSYATDFNVSAREVSLTGEAFFDVTRNPQKPFLIHTAKIEIKVLGTSFDVKSYPSDKTTETLLIRGSIEVALKGKSHEKFILRPNEKLIVTGEDSVLRRQPHIQPGTAIASEDSHITIQPPTYERNTGTIVETSWINDKLEFQDEKFSELALKMERWYGVTIRFADPSLEELRLTGTFRDETIREALDAMRLTAPFSYTIDENQITIAK
jgi:transmembrane sensor